MQALETFIGQSPVAVYLVDKDGQFVAANHKLCELLNIPPTEITRHNIAQYYGNPDERTRLVEEAEAGVDIQKRVVTFVVDGRPIQVQMFCHMVFEGDRRIGFLGALVEVTEEAAYRDLFGDHLPAGVYRIDADDRVTQANTRFAQMHGFASVAEVKGLNVQQFYADPADAERIRERLLRQESLRRMPVRLKRQTGEIFAAYLTAIPFFKGQVYDGRGGLVEDAENDRAHRMFFDEIPVGFYRVELIDGREVVVDCNQEFAKIHEKRSPADVIGIEVNQLHASAQETLKLRQKLQEATRTGTAVLGLPLKIKTAIGERTIEINTLPRVQDGVITGRTGVIRDITEEVEMRDHIESIQSDIGWLLHIFRQTLQHLKLCNTAVTEVLTGDLNSANPIRTPQQLGDEIRASLRDLAASVGVMIRTVRATTHTSALPESEIERLEQIVDVMSRAERDVQEFHRRDVWRRGAVEIQGICKRVSAGAIARGIYRPVEEAAKRIASTTGLATLAVAIEAIDRIDSPVVSVREFVETRRRQVEVTERVTIETCVSDAITNVTGFAEECRVQIHFDARATKSFVEVARRTITRGIENLLHNAIKYSWRREDGRTVVNVAVSITETARAVVSVENWGVPVPQDEIEGGLVFRLGFRGRFSTDRGRPGTGIGLADSLAIARSYKGAVRIESRPANPIADPKLYQQPFITTTYFEIPTAGALKGERSR